MAQAEDKDSGNPDDPYSLEHYERAANPHRYIPPAERERQAAEARAATQADIERTFPMPAGGPESQFGYNNPLLQPLRGAMIGLNQAGIGLAGIPIGLGNLAWRGAHWLAGGTPSDPGEPPAWTYSSGPGSYANALTLSDLTPQNEWERDLAAGARTAGAAAPLAMTGLGMPAYLTAIGSSVAGEELTEHGHPNLGMVVDVGGNVLAGRGYSPRMPQFIRDLQESGWGAWQNVPPTAAQSTRSLNAQAARAQAQRHHEEAMAQAQQHHDELRSWIRQGNLMDAMSPITNARSWAGAILNAGIMGVSGATQAARNILRSAAGTTAGNLAGAYMGSEAGANLPSPLNVGPPIQMGTSANQPPGTRIGAPQPWTPPSYQPQ